MGNRYKLDIAREKIKILAPDKTVPEIAAETGYKIPSILSALHAMGIKAKLGYHRKSKKPSTPVAKQEVKAVRPADVRVWKLSDKGLEDITLLDIAIAERNKCQERVFTLNKVIEILSA
jgi:hypothetical protein